MPKELNAIELKIIQLYQDGMGTRFIGMEVGRTKNSVCGFLSRCREWGYLGPAMKRPKADTDLRKEPVKRVIGNRPSAIKMRYFREMNLQSKIAAAQDLLNPPDTRGITFEKLKNNSCRYIISGGNGRPHMYCGEPKQHKSYCLYHASICYIPSERRERKSA